METKNMQYIISGSFQRALTVLSGTCLVTAIRMLYLLSLCKSFLGTFSFCFQRSNHIGYKEATDDYESQ
jgi:hypothetical protein